MGPEYFYSGKGIAVIDGDFCHARLQWGRSISTPESRRLLRSAYHPVPASMGPEYFYSGKNLTGIADIEPCLSASMGPEYFYSGKSKARSPVAWTVDASMGPEYFYSGKLAEQARDHRRQVASMGPEYFYSGKKGTGDCR